MIWRLSPVLILIIRIFWVQLAKKLALKKRGIFRANKPVVIGEPNVPQPMLEQAEKLHCHVSRRDVTWSFKANEQTWMWQSNKSAVRKSAVLPNSIS